MSTIKEVKKKLEILINTNEKQCAVPFLKGKPGIGKSHIIAQFAKEHGLDIIDLRLSQIESSDIRGLPRVNEAEGITKWYPQEFFPFKGVEKYKGTKGILFLDEFNRARIDVLNAVFQLIYDRAVGSLELMDSWYIITAGNLGNEDGCDVFDLDAATLDRLVPIEVDVNVDDWLTWADANDINGTIKKFIKSHPQYLWYEVSKDKKLYITPRTWERMHNVIKNNPTMALNELVELVGVDIIDGATPKFLEFINTIKDINGKEILNNYPRIKHDIDNMERSKIQGVNEELIQYIKELKDYTPNNIVNFHDFVKTHIHEDQYFGIIHTLVKYIQAEDSTNKDMVDKFLNEYVDTYVEENDFIADILDKTGLIPKELREAYIEQMSRITEDDIKAIEEYAEKLDREQSQLEK